MPGIAGERRPPGNFANAPFDEAVGRLVAILRRERPHVVITYPDIQDGYQHPDHLRVLRRHDRRRAGGRRPPPPHPWAGPAWDVPKLYYTIWTRARMQATHQAILELGLESPYDDSWFQRPWQDFRVTTSVDISTVWDRRKAALLAHATQIDPASPFWFALPDDVARTVHPYEEYHLARSNVPVELPEVERVRRPQGEGRRRCLSGTPLEFLLGGVGGGLRGGRLVAAGTAGGDGDGVDGRDRRPRRPQVRAGLALRAPRRTGCVGGGRRGRRRARPTLAVAQPWDDALAALQGTVTLDESVHRAGSTKVVGSIGLFMGLLPVLRSDEWRAAWESVAARTTA